MKLDREAFSRLIYGVHTLRSLNAQSIQSLRSALRDHTATIGTSKASGDMLTMIQTRASIIDLRDQLDEHQRDHEQYHNELKAAQRHLRAKIEPVVLNHAVDSAAMDWWSFDRRFDVSVNGDGTSGRIHVTEGWYSYTPPDIARAVANNLRRTKHQLGLNSWQIKQHGPTIDVRLKKSNRRK